MSRPSPTIAWLSVLALVSGAAGAVAQGRTVRIRTPLGAIVQEAPASAQDGGVAVRMFESPNLDRFLRRAQDFLSRDNFTAAIRVLQDVLEGRTLTADGPAEDPAGGDEPADDPAKKDSADEVPFEEENPANAVFSSDDRLYRPVRRLCHELLAQMAEAGRALYRQQFEVAAERELDAALDRRDVQALQALHNRYFLTLNAARAMNAAGDLQMHDGRFRAAIQTFRTLLDVYPDEQRRLVAGLSDPYIETKIAVCFVQLGERKKAAEYLVELAARYPDESVRIMGELVPVAGLGQSELFRDARYEGAPDAPREVALRFTEDDLLPAWEFRFEAAKPYQRAKSTQQNRVWHSGGQSSRMVSPPHNYAKPGGTVAVDGARMLFMEHLRLRVHDLRSGLMLDQGDGPLTPSRPDANKPRQRVAIYDYATMRPVFDDERCYAIVGPERTNNLQGMGAVLRNELVAYDRRTFKRLWAVEHKNRNVTGTFLAAPTVFGDRLFVPMLLKDAYALDCLDAATGERVFRVWLHSGGTPFARAPAVPVRVHMGMAYVLTNAGALAAVDAFTGDLQWVRKYERVHPLRPGPRFRRSTGNNNPFGMGNFFRTADISGFAPSDLIAIEGRILVAPADGKVMLCIDGASGDILWLVSKGRDKWRHVVGHNGRDVFLAGANDLTCIDLRSGVRKWLKEMPDQRYQGRGAVTDQWVVLPGERQLYVLAADGSQEWRHVALPKFSVGEPPLAGPCNLHVDGAYLVASYESGIEVYASVAGLHEMAARTDDYTERARHLIQAGDLTGAITVYEAMLGDARQPRGARERAARQALAIVRDVALAMGAHGAGDDAHALLDRAGGWVGDYDLRARWQLTRIELLRELGDRDAVESAQEQLYRIMEGRTDGDGN